MDLVCDSGCARVVDDTDGLPVFEVDDDVDVFATRCWVADVATFSLSSVEDCSVTHWRRT
jgi:hypothetical protein